MTPDDVWSTATKTGQASGNYTLDPAACAHALSLTPNLEPVQCDLGFPFSPDGALATIVNVATDVAVIVQDNQAVALTFAGHTRLSESRKIALLYQAATWADR